MSALGSLIKILEKITSLDESERVLRNLREFVTTECSPFEPPQVRQTIQPSVVQEVYLALYYVTANVAGYVKKIMKRKELPRMHQQNVFLYKATE
nr:unnamed protein product [Callosobruchus analis]